MLVNYSQRISEANRAIISLKFTRAANALVGVLAITQIVSSALSLAGYLSVNTLASLNIATVALIIIVPAIGLSRDDYDKRLKFYKRGFCGYLTISTLVLASFIFANAFAMTGKISLQSLAYLSFCSPIIIMMVVAPCAMYGMSLDQAHWIRLHQDQTVVDGRLLIHKEQMKRLLLSGATDPRSHEHEDYQQAVAAFPNDYPGGIESIRREIRDENLSAAWIAWKSDIENLELRGRFNKASAEVVRTDGKDYLGKILKDLQK